MSYRGKLYANVDGDDYEVQFDDLSQSENWRQGVERIDWDEVTWIAIDGVIFANRDFQPNCVQKRYEEWMHR